MIFLLNIPTKYDDRDIIDYLELKEGPIIKEIESKSALDFYLNQIKSNGIFSHFGVSSVALGMYVCVYICIYKHYVCIYVCMYVYI